MDCPRLLYRKIKQILATVVFSGFLVGNYIPFLSKGNWNMSNTGCASLYTNIIEEVILESRQDFENAGIDEQTLQDLRNIWRQRLLATKVATFPWASEIDPEINDNDNDEDDDDDDDEDNDNENDNDNNNNEIKVKIKDEDADDALFETIPTDGLPVGAPVSMTMTKNGQDGGVTLEIQKDPSSIISAPTTINPSSISTAPRETSKRNDDFDSDDDDLGSDLGNDSDAINSDLDDSDDEDDNDGDENGEFEGGDSTGNDIEQNIMLCLYERVQRVRNRWKCSLKDGLMNINGKDYVFQKATGDSEW